MTDKTSPDNTHSGALDTPAVLPAVDAAVPATPSPDKPAPHNTIGAQARLAPRHHWSPWVVWLVPVVAAAVGGWIVLQAILAKGPTITIHFKNAEGLEAGKTKIKYKDVDIGDVKSIRLARDRKDVTVTAQLIRNADSFLRQDTRFWVVRPRIGSGGVSGLSTLLSGAYIGMDAGKSDEEQEDFEGLEKPPVVLTGLPGRQFNLHTPQAGSLEVGSPVYYRRLQAGQVVDVELDKNGQGITVTVFINAPFDQYVKTDSLFWQASGVDVKLDADGVNVHAESLVSMVAGGIAFQAASDEAVGALAAADASFRLFPTRERALQHPDTEVRKVLMYFKESVRGLAPGAPVDFRGIVIGEVGAVSLEYDAKAGIYRFPVEVNIYPERLRTRVRSGTAAPKTDNDEGRAVLTRLVEHGLRAQLKTGNLVTGMLYVALDFFPDAPRARLDWRQDPIVIATVPGTLEELQTRFTSIAAKLDKLPLDGVTTDLRRALSSMSTTLKSTDRLVTQFDSKLAPEARATLAQVRKSVASVDQSLGSDAPLQQDLRETLTEIRRAAQALRSLTDYLDRHPDALIRGKKEDLP